MNKVLEIKNLTKNYKDKQALKGISFEAYEGEILCFLGPNGAGKSTMINILSTSLKQDFGTISFNGELIDKRIKKYKRVLGIVPQDLAIYEDISAASNVRYFASLYGIKGQELDKNVKNALEFVGLSGKAGEKVKTFSGGMKRRLNIACALAHDPSVIIMDEPTVGIDPQSRNHILESIKCLRELGKTILYTTHYIEEVEEISTRIIIIDHGDIIAMGTKEQIKEDAGSEKIIYLEVEDLQEINQDDFFTIEGVKKVDISEKTIMITTLKGVENLENLIALILNQGLKIRNISTISESLELVFLKLTGRSLRD